jgi:GlcNAc-P-P-Und epimerase
MKVLVTGGSGFIGARLVEELLAGRHEVRILDKVQSVRHAELCQVGDVRDPDVLQTAVKNVDLVYALAAEHQDNVRPTSLYYDVNVGGAEKLAAACLANGVSRIVFTSSVAVYGLNAGEPSEESVPRPFNHYGQSKLQAEEILRGWADRAPGAQLTIVRPAAIFGEGNRGNVYNLASQIMSGRFVMIGQGSNRKSMGYVGNVAAFLASLGEWAMPGTRTFNYADKPDLSMMELVDLVTTWMGKPSGSWRRLPYAVGMAGGVTFDLLSRLTGKTFRISSARIRKFCGETTVSIERLRDVGFIPPYTLAEGMNRFLTHEIAERRQRERTVHRRREDRNRRGHTIATSGAGAARGGG